MAFCTFSSYIINPIGTRTSVLIGINLHAISVI